jgi:hypothetical protein
MFRVSYIKELIFCESRSFSTKMHLLLLFVAALATSGQAFKILDFKRHCGKELYFVEGRINSLTFRSHVKHGTTEYENDVNCQIRIVVSS